MPYNPYFPATYQPVQPMPQQPMPQQPQQSGNGLIWVQGESGAKSYLLAPSQTVMLMDSEADRFYLKSSDASGMPLPLRTFEYRETTQSGGKSASEAVASNLSGYVTKDEFDALKRIVEGLTEGKNESAV